jgi:glycoside/pentoside/hexuronide:cation symporter, GPH family
VRSSPLGASLVPDGSDATAVAPAEAFPGLSLRTCLGWGIGTIGIAILFNTVNLLLLRFLTDFLGIAAAFAGFVLALSKIYDAITDPLMGYISDRTKGRLGRRRPYLVLGGVLCALSLPMLFLLPSIVSVDARIAVVVFAAFFYSTAYTVFNVPYLAMASDMPLRYHERSKLMSFRVSSIGVGQLLAGVLAPLLVGIFGGAEAGFAAMSVVLGVFVLMACWGSYLGTAGVALTPPEVGAAETSKRMNWTVLAHNRPFALLIGMKFLQLSGFAILQSSLAYFVFQVLQAGGGMLATIFTVQTIMLIGSMPIWLMLSRRLGKIRSFQLGAVVFFLSSLAWLITGPDYPLVLIVLQSVLIGFGSAGMLLIGQSLLPDTIAWDRRLSGENRAGALTGLYSTAEKIAFAAGLAITGLLLGAGGYVAGQGTTVGMQPDSALRAIYACVGLVPGLFSLSAAALLMFYRLDASALEAPQPAPQTD